MAKKIFLVFVVLGVAALFFIPATRQKSITIKSSFLNVYSSLASPEKWEQWRPELRNMFFSDSTRILVNKTQSGFILKYAPLELDIKPKGGYFDINEQVNSQASEYAYFVTPGKKPTETQVTVYQPTNVVGHLFDKFRAPDFAETHIDQFKKFMETDSLRYGFKIFKTRVPTAFLIVSAGTVPNSARFAEAAALAARLQKFADDQHLKKTQPVIAQFNPASKDSTFVKVGFYIDREAKPGGGVQFNRMPVGGPLYGAVFSGRFDKRQRAYNALIQYYTDRSYQSAILPFEMYLDDHLPVSDTDKVLVRVTFSGYF